MRVEHRIRCSKEATATKIEFVEKDKANAAFHLHITNMSLTGIHFLSEKELNPNDEIMLKVKLAGHEDLELKCSLTRAEKLGEEHGYGAKFLGNNYNSENEIRRYMFHTQKYGVMLNKQ